MTEVLSGRYEIIEQLNPGDTGEIFLARDRQNKELVWITFIPVASLPDNSIIDTLKKEIGILQSLENDHILPLLAGELEGEFFLIVTKHMTGGTLSDRLQNNNLEFDHAIQIIQQIGSALSVAHKRGLIHGDLKPENIHFDEEGNAYLAGFGFYQFMFSQYKNDPSILVGPLGYMSPEQATGAVALDERSDIYSLGAIFYQLLAGNPPYIGTSPLEVAVQHSILRPPEITSSAAPKWAKTAICKAMQKDPADRFQSVDEFIDDLTKRRVSPLATVMSIAIVAVIALLSFSAIHFWPVLNPSTTPTTYALALESTRTPWPEQHTRTETLTPSSTPEPDETTGETNQPVPSTKPTNSPSFTPSLTPSPEITQTPAPTITSIYHETTTAYTGDYPVLINDTIFDIASKLQTNLSYLLSINDLSCDSRLYPEQRQLSVPPPGVSNQIAPKNPITSNTVNGLEVLHSLECMLDISALEFSPNGEILAAASDTDIFLWRVSNWNPLYRIKAHLAKITSLVFSPDGKQLATGSSDRSVRIWSVDSGELLQTLNHGNEITDLAYSPDGKQLAVTSRELIARVYQVSDWQVLKEFRGYQTTSAAYSPDGKMLAIAYNDRVDLFNPETFELLQSLKTKSESITVGNNIAFSSNSLLLATSNHLWQVREADPIYYWPGSPHRTFFTPDIEALFIGPNIMRLRDGNPVLELELQIERAERRAYDYDSIALSPDGHLIAWGSLDGIFLMGLPDDLQASGESGDIYHVEEDDNFYNIASKHDVQLKSLFNENTLTCENKPYISQSLVIPHNTAGTSSNTATISTLNINEISNIQDLDMSCATELGRLDISQHGNFLVSGSDVWNLVTGSILIKGESFGESTEVETEDDNELGTLIKESPTEISSNLEDPTAAVIAGNIVEVWDLTTGKLRHKLEGHAERITNIAYSPDGKILVSSGLDESIRLWNPKTGEELDFIQGFTAADLILTPDNRLLISIAGDTARFWPLEPSNNAESVTFLNKQTGRPQKTISGMDGIYRLTQDGKYFSYLACAEPEGSHCNSQFVNLIQTEGNFIEAHRYLGPKALIQDYAISPDSQFIAIVSENTIEISDVESERKLLHPLVGEAKYAERIQDMRFTPDSSMLITQVSNQLLRFWDVKTGDLIIEQKIGGLQTWIISADQKNIAILAYDRISIWGVVP